MRGRVCGEKDSAVALAVFQVVVNFYIHTYFEADFFSSQTAYSFIKNVGLLVHVPGPLVLRWSDKYYQIRSYDFLQN